MSKISLKSTLFVMGMVAVLLLIILFLTPRLLGQTSSLRSSSLTSVQTPKTMSYHTNIITDTQANVDFRRVLFTGTNSQLVIMSIPPGGEVGKETHKYTEQSLFFLSGTGIGELDGKQFPIVPGDVVVVVPGTEHNFWNTGTTDLKIYTVYAPPNHIDGRIQVTKAAADADTADEAVGETPPVVK